MAHVSGEYKTICDGLLDGYKGKVYGYDGPGTENDSSYTMQKVVIKNGKVVSETGELPLDVIANLGQANEDKTNEEVNNEIDNETNLGENNISQQGTNATLNDSKLPKTGEENNTFVKWLSIVIILGIFWLLSMLLIDREKKKINQSTIKRK